MEALRGVEASGNMNRIRKMDTRMSPFRSNSEHFDHITVSVVRDAIK